MIIAAVSNQYAAPAMASVLAEANKQVQVFGNGGSIDLGSSAAALDEELASIAAREKLNQLKNNQADLAALENASPVFDYAVRSLNGLLNDVASKNGDKVSTDCGNFITLYKLTNGVIHLATNEAWSFRLVLRGVSMDIFCAGDTSSTIQYVEDSNRTNIQTRLRIGDKDLETKDTTLADYKVNVDFLLTRLLAAQQKAAPVHK